MVECGSMDQPPSFKNLTIWGIVTLVFMLLLGIDSIIGLISGIVNNDGFYYFLLLVGSACGIVGLILVLITVITTNGTFLWISLFFFLSSCIIHIVLLLICLIGRDEGVNLGSIFQIALDLFLSFLFYRQSGGF